MYEHELDDQRARRRDRACAGTGLLAGAGLGLLAGAFIPPGGIVLSVVGAVAGVVAGRAIAPRISADDWEPRSSRRSYVGASSPDDDIAS
jgi:hypothetical protein